jgi:hypothetical protein
MLGPALSCASCRLGVPGQPFRQQVQARLTLEIIVFAPLAQTLVALNAPALSLRHFLAALVVVCGDDGGT